MRFDKKRFVLAGHSFGGLISAFYAERCPEQVERLLLLSPFALVGVSQDDDKFKQRIANLQWHKKALFKMSMIYWRTSRASPLSLLRKTRCLSLFFVRMYMRERLKGVPKEHFAAFSSYLNYILMQEAGSDNALTIVMNGMTPSLPIESVIGNLPMPIAFFYGDRDFMDFTNVSKVRIF